MKTNIQYKTAEEAIKSLKLKEVSTPSFYLLQNKLERRAIPSTYKKQFYYLENKVLSFVMAMPLAAAALALFISFNSADSVYLASNDIGREEANVRILNNISDLENLGN